MTFTFHPFEIYRSVRVTARPFLLGAFFLLLATTAHAIPLNEYHQNLQRAINALDSLENVDEDETEVQYEQRVGETITAVRGALPEKQPIESGGSTCNVDNSWLHDELDEFEAATAEKRETVRRQVIERLQSIEERVKEAENAHPNGLSKTEASRKLNEILSRSEFTTKNSQSAFLFRLLDRFIKWLSRFLPQRSPLAPSKGSPLTVIAQIFVVGLAAAVIIYVLFKVISLFGKRSRKTTVKTKREPRIVLGERLEPEASATDLLAEAEALARKGEIRAAIRKTYIALLVELGDRKIISLAQHKTNRDYLRAVSHVPNLHQNMCGLTDSFERHWYGFAQTSPTDWQDFRAAYLAALRKTD